MSNNLLDQASAARLNGDDQAAIEMCRQLLATDPNNIDAMSMLGASLAETGQLDEARRLITAALTAGPDNWRFLLNQSILQECESNLAAAFQTAEQAGAVAPDKFEVWGRIGDLSGKRGNFPRAVEALTKALSINPDHPALSLRLAGACYEIGDYAHASNALDNFDKFAPGHPHALRLRTHIARQTGDWDGLVESASAWLEVSPDEEAARAALAFAYAEPGFYVRAAEAYKPLTDANPNDPDHLTTMGKYLLGARDLNAAEHYYRRALNVDPSDAEANAGLGRLTTFLGRFDEAIDFCRKAIATNPSHIEAYGQLAVAANAKLTDDEIEQLIRLGNDESIDVEQRALCFFTAGDAQHRHKDHDAAFKSWTRANRLKHSVGDISADARYLPEAHEQFTNRIIQIFDINTSPTQQACTRRPAPIFIVGVPRSGTTLLESALSTHREVASGGELPLMPYATQEVLAWADEVKWGGGILPDHIIEDIRNKYFAQYRDYGIQDANYVTDKQPNNFLSISLIRQVFPEARIIFIRRNPVETGFSIYRRNFSRTWKFANSLEEIGHYYGQYARVKAHWFETLGDELGFIQYEDLVRDFEGQLKRLVAFCGLEWDANCLEYYKQDRTVITFSTAQVRKPPSAKHLNSTKPYRAGLQPLITTLEKAGVDLETGALMSEAGR